MTAAAAQSAGDFLIDTAERMGIGCTPGFLRGVLIRACGGRLDARTPDGVRASGITLSGTPFEASVTGGRGRYAPVLRYVTETTTWEPEFAVRLQAYLSAIAKLVAQLPNGNEGVVDLLHSFVTTVYPDPAAIEPGRRLAMWLGIVHHAAVPDRLAGLKVYCSPTAGAHIVKTVGRRWPGFEGLSPVPGSDALFQGAGLAIEVDTLGEIKYKTYLRARPRDVAVPMKMIRYFGDAAWETLSEFTRCGVDAAELHNFDYFVGCARHGDGAPSYTISLVTRRSEDLTALARELARRHHGTPRAIDAMADAASASGAHWCCSGLGLGFSPEHGIDKLNLYGTPTWEKTSDSAELRSSRRLARSEDAH